VVRHSGEGARASARWLCKRPRKLGVNQRLHLQWENQLATEKHNCLTCLRMCGVKSVAGWVSSAQQHDYNCCISVRLKTTE
jgi:hypothetical protein